MGIVKSDHSLVGGQDDAGADGKSRYCYLFPDLANAKYAGLFKQGSAQETLTVLKEFEQAFHPPQSDAPPLRMKLPAVYTYFGQFVNHDMSAPVGGMLVDVAEIANQGVLPTQDLPGLSKEWRAETIGPILDHFQNEHEYPLTLSSLYGDGPSSTDPEVQALYLDDGMRFLITQAIAPTREEIGEITEAPFESIHRNPGAWDIPRKDGIALLADRRNDGNLILSQLHLAFMLLHNKAVDILHPQMPDSRACFTAARRLVTLHYQWCIVADYLPNLLSRGVLEKVMAAPPRLTNAKEVPMEFTTAAFRFGHSMVGSMYDFNANFGAYGRISGAALLQDLFHFTSRGGMAGRSGQLPDHWLVDWQRLIREDGEELGQAERIDMNFANDMLNVVGESNQLALGSIFLRNILRGFHRRIPFGQDLAKAYGVPVLDVRALAAAMPETTPGLRRAAQEMGFLAETPAWVYFLCEASALEDGQRLGPTASHIIADTFIGLMKNDPESVLRAEGGGWHPRTSPLKFVSGEALTSIGAMLLFAVEGSANANGATPP